MSADPFSEGEAERLITNVHCIGNESKLLDCDFDNFEGFICTTSGVICQGIIFLDNFIQSTYKTYASCSHHST